MNISISNAYTMYGTLYDSYGDAVETYKVKYGSKEGDYKRAIDKCLRVLFKEMSKRGGDPDNDWVVLGCV